MAIQSTSFRVKEADGQFSQPIEFRVKDSNVVITYGADDSGTLDIKLDRLDKSLKDYEDRVKNIEIETIPTINDNIDSINENITTINTNINTISSDIGLVPDGDNLVNMVDNDRIRLNSLESFQTDVIDEIITLKEKNLEISTQIGNYISPILLNLEVQNGATIFNFAFGENAVGKEYIVIFDNNTTKAQVVLEDDAYVLATGDIVISTAVGSPDSIITIGDNDIHTLTLSVETTEDSIYNRLANIESLLSSLNVRLGALENM